MRNIKKKKSKPVVQKKARYELNMPQFSAREIEFKRTASLILYWSTILFLTLMNFMIALVLTPFLLATPTIQLYLIIALLGLFFGYIFNLLITRIEFLEKQHHFFAAFFIPFVAVITILTILSSVGSIAATLGLEITQDPEITLTLYAAAFIAPYVLSRIMWLFRRTSSLPSKK
jgi:hypothetical protein